MGTSTFAPADEVSRAAERYVIELVAVGSGGFGKIHKGSDVILQREIAVKSLDQVWQEATDADKERFKREARTLAKLNHPNIPAIYDVIFSADKFEIVFQFVEGATLHSVIADESAIGLQDCRVWFDQIASALEHAHAKGIIHRDIKPENMIASPDRKHCYLVDFGIALSQEEFERLTGSDSWIGTPGYMSPEQEDGEIVDASDDLFSLGVSLYESLCGHRIPPGEYKPLSATNELIPPAIDNLIQRCIAPKAQRLKTATEFRTQLRNALLRHRTLSDILGSGQLHEIAGAIRDMTAQEFMGMPAGQRLLVLQRCQDLVVAQDDRLAAARIEFLTLLTTLGILLEPAQYKRVVAPAIGYGFGFTVLDGQSTARGNNRIRDAVVNAAIKVQAPNHQVIVAEFLEWLNGVDVRVQPGWFYHSVRQLINALLANQYCVEEDAPKLATKLEQINDLHRSRVQDHNFDAE